MPSSWRSSACALSRLPCWCTTTASLGCTTSTRGTAGGNMPRFTTFIAGDRRVLCGMVGGGLRTVTIRSSTSATTMMTEEAASRSATVSAPSSHCMFCPELTFIPPNPFINLKKVLLYFPQGECCALESFEAV